MDIYQALRQDHDKVKNLLNQLVHLSEDGKTQKSLLISKIRDELIPHSRAEEAVFYNSLRMLDASKDLAMHGYKEHMEAETFLRTLQAMDFLDSEWKPTALKLQKAVVHHIEEEEGEMFQAGRELFTKEEALAMATTFEKMKPEIKKGGFVKSTLDMVVNLMPPRLSDKFRNFNPENRK